MAQIKINRSQARINPIETPRVSGLAIDPNIMINYGNAIASVGKVVEDAKLKTQKTQDTNDARALFMEAQKSIMQSADTYKNTSNVADVDNFYDDVHLDKFKSILKPYNKEVQKLFATDLYKSTNDIGMKLFASALKEHGALTQNNIRKDVFKNNILGSHNNPYTRDKANKENKRIFEDPNTLRVFGISELTKLKNDSIIETKMMQYSNRIKNNPMDILALGEENIANDVASETLAKQIIQNAENTLISKSIQEDTINELNYKFTKDQRINNFSHVLQQLNKGDATISLDDVNDLYKKNALNSSQRDALYSLFTNPKKLSDQNVIDMIEGSMLIAESVEEIDVLHKQILSNPEYVASLGLTEFSAYNSLFEKYRNDQPAWTEYQNNLKLLEADLGKVTSGTVSFVQSALGGATTAAKKDEKLRINASGYYKKLVMNGATPADAYLNTTSKYLRGTNISSVKDFTNFSSIELKKPTQLEIDNPSLYTENRTNELAKLYKNGAIDINAFSNDIAALDSIEQLIELRISLKEDPFGFEAKDTTTEIPPMPGTG
jgi:hypothetical protein|tara:strand:+ start:509 stop:2158 length:1650 start_codon:yes stop_codon:yes gene_type:complete